MIALIVAGRLTRHPGLDELAQALLRLAGGPDLTLSPLTASHSDVPGGFAAVKVVTPAGEWVATAAIQGRPPEELARAIGRAAAQKAAA